MTASLVLASTSPRRGRLLGSLGLSFTTLDPGVDDAREADLAGEALRRGLGPGRIVRRLAVAKLLASWRRAPADATVLAADTVVALDGALLGKARDRDHAAAMLGALRGRTHQVLTGVAIRTSAGGLRAGVAASQVRFRPFPEDALAAYLDEEVWRGKAGAYGVQDAASAPLVAEVAGSASNVVGLPLELVRELLELP